MRAMVEVRSMILSPDDSVAHRGLERQNLLLHRAARDELVAGHHAGLADAVCAIRGLILHRRVQPVCEEDQDFAPRRRTISPKQPRMIPAP